MSCSNGQILRPLSSREDSLELQGTIGGSFKDYVIIATPLTNLIIKDSFVWEKATKAFFEELQKDMITHYVLRLPDFSQAFDWKRVPHLLW